MTSTLEPLTRDREVATLAHREWIKENEDGLAELERVHALWLDTLREREALYTEHVYDNPDATQFDFRQHRAELYVSLAEGEKLAISFLRMKEKDIAKAEGYVTQLDQKLDELREVLRAWHGRISEQDDLPDWVKQGFADVEAGRVVPMEVAMSERPPSAVTKP